MRRDYDNNGNPLHETCGNCMLFKNGNGYFYCQRTYLIKSFEDSCVYHVSK